jgi:hypothetical protein
VFLIISVVHYTHVYFKVLLNIVQKICGLKYVWYDVYLTKKQNCPCVPSEGIHNSGTRWRGWSALCHSHFTPVLIEQQAGRAPGLVCMFHRRTECPAPIGNRTLDHPSHSLCIVGLTKYKEQWFHMYMCVCVCVCAHTCSIFVLIISSCNSGT